MWLNNFLKRTPYEQELLDAVLQLLRQRGLVDESFHARGEEGWASVLQLLSPLKRLRELHEAAWQKRWRAGLAEWESSGASPGERWWPTDKKSRWLQNLKMDLRKSQI